MLRKNFIKCAKLYYSGKLSFRKFLSPAKSVNKYINHFFILLQVKKGSKIDLIRTRTKKEHLTG